MIEQTSQSITFLAFYTASKVGKAGLTVTVDIHKINKATGVVTQNIIPAGSACTEVGGGLYMYRITAGVTTADVGEYTAIFKTADATVDQQHIPSLWTIGRLATPLDASQTRAAVGLATANLDTQLANLVSDAELTTALTPVMKTASYVAPLDAAGTRAALGLGAANLDTQLDNLPTVSELNARTLPSANYGNATDLAAVKTKTDNLPANPAAIGSPMTLANDSITAAVISAGGANKIADHTWDDTFAAHTVAGSMGAVMNKMNVASATGDWTVDEKTAIKAILGIPGTGTIPVIPTVGVLDAIKDKTDTITLVPPIPDPINANITHVNGVSVIGSGVPGTDAWRPA